MCRKNLPGNVVHTKSTKAAFETLKSRMISVPVLLIPKMGHEADFFLQLMLVKLALLVCSYKRTFLVP